MTYNQVVEELRTRLQSHAMIKTVKNETPAEWLKKTEVVFPVCCYSINSGTFNKGREQVYNVSFFFLDKSGVDREFEQDVISDQVGIAYDIVELIRGTKRAYTIDDNIDFVTISDGKYEDFLSGCSLTFNLTAQSEFDGCDVPTV